MMNGKYSKKVLALLMVLVIGVPALAGCSSTPAASQSAEAVPPVQADIKADKTTTEENSQTESADTESEHTNTLVVYFSATGHTAPLAKYAAEYLNADIYEIIPETAYTEEDLNYNDSSTRATKEQNDPTARPAIAGELPDISGYDTIIIGHPIWWGQAPKIIYSFLESCDWSGKTLATFCTSASSGLGSSAENLRAAASGNPNWLESRRFSIGTGEAEVIDWLQKILS